jgi:hypothetical protein
MKQERHLPVGYRSGGLVVTHPEKLKRRVGKRKLHGIFGYLCSCDYCGKTHHWVSMASLITQKAKSCGCMKREWCSSKYHGGGVTIEEIEFVNKWTR